MHKGSDLLPHILVFFPEIREMKDFGLVVAHNARFEITLPRPGEFGVGGYIDVEKADLIGRSHTETGVFDKREIRHTQRGGMVLFNAPVQERKSVP